MEPNNFEKDFRKKLNQRTIEPGNKAWDRLDAMLSVVENKKTNRKRKWLYIAAGFTGFLLVGTFFFNQNKDAIEPAKSIVIEENTKKDSVIKQSLNPVDSVQTEIVITEKISNEKPNKQEIKNLNQKQESVIIKNNLNQNQAGEVLVLSQYVDEETVEVYSKNEKYQSLSENKYVSAEKLLEEVSNAKFESKKANEVIGKTRKSISIDPNVLLSGAEKELNQSFRKSALDGLSKKINDIKTVLVNRNYEE